MAAASATQLAQWAAAAGFVGEDQAVAVAIALATGADPAAPTGAWGIGGGGDGGGQAQAAYSRFQTSGWGTFPAHATGHYLMYMPSAEAVVAQTPNPAAQPPGQNTVLDPLGLWQKATQGFSDAADQNIPVVSDVAGAIKFLENPNTWKRGVALVVGVMLMGIAFVKFGWDNVITSPIRVLDAAGDEVAHRAQVVGLFTHPSLRTPGGQPSQQHQRAQTAAAAAAGARGGVRQETRRQEGRKAAAPRPAGRHAAKPAESPKVAQARAAARAAGEEKNREYRERKARES